VSVRGGFPADVVDMIWRRDRGSCARCGRGLIRERRVADWAIHHREPRGKGGTTGRVREWVNRAANGVCLCNTCHDWIEANRTEAIRAGWLVSALRVLRPVDVPIPHAILGRVQLDDDGGWEKAA
jgi:hypothetical protein